MATREAIIQNFDPSGVGLENGNLYGLPFDYDTADIVIVGVPWEATVSYHAGTAGGPEAVLQASPQLDLYDLDNPLGWQQGIYYHYPLADWVRSLSDETRRLAASVIAATEQGIAIAQRPDLQAATAQVNANGARLNDALEAFALKALGQGKRVGVLGGDHSVPLGAMRAIAQHYPDFGLLHIDAHADLRRAYQGFDYSHASIMNQAMALPQISRLVQVGIRDISQGEVDTIAHAAGRILTHYDAVLKRQRYGGVPWQDLCEKILDPLPQQVYVSLDVDGLDPKLCPHTGTPVPGGLELEEVFYLLRSLVDSGRTIIGFDVCEVGNDEWDGNVAARIVYKLCNLMGLNQSPQLRAPGGTRSRSVSPADQSPDWA
jgi:agmatinase